MNADYHDGFKEAALVFVAKAKRETKKLDNEYQALLNAFAIIVDGHPDKAVKVDLGRNILADHLLVRSNDPENPCITTFKVVKKKNTPSDSL